MLLIGLTGSIGMGKSETARMFKEGGVAVYDADKAVHTLYERGGAAVAPIAKAFPGCVREGRVDRQLLSRFLLDHPEAFVELEAIVHPLAGEEQRRFLRNAKNQGHDMAVLDIPLLFERGGTARVDVIVVVSAPEHVQRERVLARDGMTKDKFETILSRQTPDHEKRAGADFVVDTSQGLDKARSEVRHIIEVLKGRTGDAYDRLMSSKSEEKKDKPRNA